MRYEDRRVIVTGAASGIGEATARRLAAEGANVAILDRDLDGAARVAAEIDGYVSGLDLADIETIAPACEEAAAVLGGVELLVNCAGWDTAMPFTETTPDFWGKVVTINLLGPIGVTHATLPYMPDGSAIVNVSSDAGRVGSSGEVVYSGAKAGIIGFSKALAREVASLASGSTLSLRARPIHRSSLDSMSPASWPMPCSDRRP